MNKKQNPEWHVVNDKTYARSSVGMSKEMYKVYPQLGYGEYLGPSLLFPTDVD